MSYALPILDSNGNNARFGGEFNMIYNANLRGDLQNPVTVERDYNTGEKFTARTSAKKAHFAYFSTVTSQNQFKVVENITKVEKNADIYFGQTTQNKSVP